MGKKQETKLTSVKIISKNYYEFKKLTINTDLTLQKFVNRCIDLYIKENDFKNKINSHETDGIKNSKY
jgi:hypothetical protein